MSNLVIRGRAKFAVGVMIALLAGCGGDAGSAPSDDSAVTASSVVNDASDPAATDPTQTTETTEVAVSLAVASASLIEDDVDYRTGVQTDFTTLTEPVDVAVGDTVRTDATGYGEISYFDGSVTRLDVETEFELIALVDDPGASEIRVRMGVGRTWHRVEQLTGGDVYEVETFVATATVRGTAFTITCRDETTCRFDVAEGVVELELDDGQTLTVTAPAGVEVGPDGFGEVVGLPFDAVFGDDWVTDNADRDTLNGRDSAGAIYQVHGISYASLSGTYTGTLVPQGKTDCIPDCGPWDIFYGPTDLTPKNRTFVFDIDCSAGLPCTGTGDIERAAGIETFPVVYDGTTLTFAETTEPDTYCSLDFESDGVLDLDTGVGTVSTGYRLTPSAAEIIDDRWVVTALTGEGYFDFVIDDYGRCGELPNELLGVAPPGAGSGYSEDQTIEMVRSS